VTGRVLSAEEIPKDIVPRLTPVPGGKNVILGAYRLFSVLPDGLGESTDYQILCSRGRELAQVCTVAILDTLSCCW
jgi:hypothetical protein